ncbi:C40 family peptidase [Gordonia sp. HY285]|uniref:C40 family peptidase n=1 Tax=Gordonia liuliyuniae TaxID=2911517 RepID=UPI001F433238|nr:C40 family peptidase [Gordonia liuliyuniae]MCF8611753.1 C40 family peptidase [Gordonia liuliyuniae]
MSAALLIAPLKMLVSVLGTGVLPPGATTALGNAETTLTAASDESARTVAAVKTGWKGDGGNAAASTATTLAAADSAVGRAGTDVATTIESAAGHVRTANTALNALVESFVTAASAVPAIATPAGLATLIPLALDHIARGVQVIQKAQTELEADTAALGRHNAPAEVTTGSTQTTATRGEGTKIVLPDGSTVYAPNERAATAVRAALSVQGTPYVWGGTTTDGFDCSGLTQWAYQQAGVDLPRLAQDQDTAGVAVSQSDLQPGDLAVWSGHVAMYIGNGQYVETGGDPVGVSPLYTNNAGQSFEGFYRPNT